MQLRKVAFGAMVLSLAAHHAAKAQLPVTDVGTHILEQLQVANSLKELANWVTQLQQMQNQLNQLMQTYQALSHVTDLASAVGALNALGVQNPLPVNPYAVQGLLSGGQSPTGMLGSLSGLLNGVSGYNTVYTPGTTSWASGQNAAYNNGLAGAQAMALQLYQSAAQRYPLLQELQARIATAKDPADREALIARIQLEQAYIQNSQTQAVNLGNYMAAQTQVAQIQQAQRVDQSAYAYLRDQQQRGYINASLQLPQP